MIPLDHGSGKEPPRPTRCMAKGRVWGHKRKPLPPPPVVGPRHLLPLGSPAFPNPDVPVLRNDHWCVFIEYVRYSVVCRFASCGPVMCVDIDECKQPVKPCDQLCHNSPGTYHCSCRDGYLLNVTDNRSCSGLNAAIQYTVAATRLFATFH